MNAHNFSRMSPENIIWRVFPRIGLINMDYIRISDSEQVSSIAEADFSAPLELKLVIFFIYAFFKNFNIRYFFVSFQVLFINIQKPDFVLKGSNQMEPTRMESNS